MIIGRDVASISIPQSQSLHETTTGFTEDRLDEIKEFPPKQSSSNQKSQPLIETINGFTKETPDEIKKELLEQSYFTHHSEFVSGGINGCDKEEKTPLIHAILKGDLFTIQWLCTNQQKRYFLHQNPGFYQTDIYDMNASMYAHLLNNQDILVELAEYTRYLSSYAEEYPQTETDSADEENLQECGEDFIHDMENLINEEVLKECPEQEMDSIYSEIENLKGSDKEDSGDESVEDCENQQKKAQTINYPARFFSVLKNQNPQLPAQFEESLNANIKNIVCPMGATAGF